MPNKKYSHILAHFKKQDPKVYAVMKNINFDDWFTEQTANYTINDYFIALCREIIGQQLSGKAANTIFGRFKNLFAIKRLTPQNILKLADQSLRDVGLSWAKVRYVKELAKQVQTKKIDLTKLPNLSEDQIIAELIKIKGIGNWTAEMFMIFILKRENVFSHGDLGLKKGFEKIYSRNSGAAQINKKGPTKAHIEKVIKKWEPYKTYGSIALWHSLG